MESNSFYFETRHQSLEEGCVYNRFGYDFKFILTNPSTNPNPTGKAASMRTQGTVWH